MLTETTVRGDFARSGSRQLRLLPLPPLSIFTINCRATVFRMALQRPKLAPPPRFPLLLDCYSLHAINSASILRTTSTYHEPGKQARSAIRIKNSNKSHVAFKFDEQRDQVTVESILCVVFFDPESSNLALEKLQCQLAKADVALEAIKKKLSANAGPQVNDEGLVLDEWKERKEKYLARQQVEVLDSM